MSKLPLPNYFQCPNIITDEFMNVLSASSFKMIVLLVRQTVGWQKQITTSTSQAFVIEKTGMSRSTVWRAQTELKKHGLIKVYGSKKEGYSYEVNYEISHNWNWKTFLMFQNETYEKYGLMFQNETSYVSNLNILYILNTTLKDNNKKYIKKNTPKTSSKSKVTDLKSKEVFEEFKAKFEFINFSDYLRLVEHLEKLNGSVTKKRISNNLNKCKNKNDGKFVDAKKFKKVVSDFVGQVKYQGVFVSSDFANNSKNNTTPQTAARKLKEAKAMARGKEVDAIDTDVIEEAS